MKPKLLTHKRGLAIMAVATASFTSLACYIAYTPTCPEFGQQQGEPPIMCPDGQDHQISKCTSDTHEKQVGSGSTGYSTFRPVNFTCNYTCYWNNQGTDNVCGSTNSLPIQGYEPDGGDCPSNGSNS